LIAAFALLPGLSGVLVGDELKPSESENSLTLEPIAVNTQRVANLQPASTYESIVTALRYDPQIDLQARGLPEGQADITVRGGVFENSGFRIGSVSILDPQTGHYAVELPIDPVMLSTPKLLTDAEHGLGGFNATVATISYGFAKPRSGGALSVGFGTDNLRYGSIAASHQQELSNGRQIGGTISAAGSRGDGTLPNGDHDFKRFSLHLQTSDENSESNMILGYQDKFFGWPGAYTGFASLPETDHAKLGLFILDHRVSNNAGWWEVGAAYRWLDDDYDFDRRTTESGTAGSFEHETRSFSLGIAGLQHLSGIDWNIFAQFAADELVRSTDLTHGNFNSRSYLSLSLAPGFQWTLDSAATLSLLAGLRMDFSNRDEDALMPLLGLALEESAGEGNNRFSLDFSRTSQLPGYTALNSAPRGLFGGNADLDREYANTLTLGAEHENRKWQIRGAVFYRRDKDLVDWTFSQSSPSARQANPVDLDVAGLEVFFAWRSTRLDLTGGYTWLHKNADYGSATVDASYYALNYARHRFTLALLYRLSEQFDIRLDNEYRRQVDNVLRSGELNAYTGALSASWRPDFLDRMRLTLVVDNLTDNEFQEFPGTPAYGRQVSLGLGLDW
jgi:vitamin B12 transporter